MRKIKTTFLLIFILICVAQIAQATPFQNGGFDSGNFTGWTGELTDINYDVFSVDPDSSSYYQIVDSDNKAKLSLDDTYWQNTLYQDFELDTLLPGWTMSISFWLKWSPTDTGDGLSVTLSDLSDTDTVDLLANVSNNDLLTGILVTEDITSFVQTYGGQDVELSFSIWDVDMDPSDTLMIDNISFTQAPAPVPEPSTILLFGAGLAGLGIFQRRKKNRAG